MGTAQNFLGTKQALVSTSPFLQQCSSLGDQNFILRKKFGFGGDTLQNYTAAFCGISAQFLQRFQIANSGSMIVRF